MSRQTATSVPSSVASDRGANGMETPVWGWLLSLWMALVVMLHGVIWTTGVTDFGLAQAVENGVAEVEKQQLGEESEDVVRKAIQMQRDTLPFWTVIAALGDYIVAPLTLGLRAFAVAVVMSAVAATSGRQVRFPLAMYESVVWQGVWVLGIAVRVVLMLVLQRSIVNTSIIMFLPQESFTATQWTLLGQVDCFALIGWFGMAWSARCRGQANLLVAVIVCVFLALVEFSVSTGASLVINLSMRMALMPQ